MGSFSACTESACRSNVASINARRSNWNWKLGSSSGGDRLLRRRRLLWRTGGPGLLRGAGTECDSEIAKIQRLRYQDDLEIRPAVGSYIHSRMAADIAVAELSGDVGKRKVHVCALHMGRDPVGGRQWQRKSGQVVQIGQVLSADIGVDIEPAEVEWPGDRSGERDA
jgi:hypothetical protein